MLEARRQHMQQRIFSDFLPISVLHLLFFSRISGIMQADMNGGKFGWPFPSASYFLSTTACVFISQPTLPA